MNVCVFVENKASVKGRPGRLAQGNSEGKSAVEGEGGGGAALREHVLP